jgi:hypothetical protein
MDKKEKKDFKETKLYAFLKKAGQAVPDIIGLIPEAALAISTGNIAPILTEVAGLLRGKEIDTPEATALRIELERERHDMAMEIETLYLEYYKIDAEDRDGARLREVEVTKATGKRDAMQVVAGSIGLLAFILIVVAGLFLPIKNLEFFNAILGYVMGVSTMIFAYFYGSSKGSADKNNLITRR